MDDGDTSGRMPPSALGEVSFVGFETEGFNLGDADMAGCADGVTFGDKEGSVSGDTLGTVDEDLASGG